MVCCTGSGFWAEPEAPWRALFAAGRGRLDIMVRRAVEGMEGSVEVIERVVKRSIRGAIWASLILSTRGPRLVRSNLELAL